MPEEKGLAPGLSFLNTRSWQFTKGINCLDCSNYLTVPNDGLVAFLRNVKPESGYCAVTC